MANWTKNNIPDLTDKIFIVTGANSGLGYESTLGLAEKGATVIMACRNLERAQHSLDSIRPAAPSARLNLMELDLASLKTIRTFAETFKSKYEKLDVLINNAAATLPPRSVTEDGFETQMGVNYLGHYALTGLLLDSLVNTHASRVVTLASREHSLGTINWDDLMAEKSYDRFTAYRQSKLANLLFTFELQRRFETAGVTTISVAAHPGRASTNWPDNLSGLERIFYRIMIRLLTQSASIGALSVLYAAVDSQVKPGSYYGPEHDIKGYPAEARASENAYNETDAKRLWELSEKLTGVKYETLNI